MSLLTPVVIFGIPTFGKVSIHWALARTRLAFPLGSTSGDFIILNRPIAEARNEIVNQALKANADYLFFIADDVLVPPNAFLQMQSHEVDMCTGIYWTKGYPLAPYIWKGLQRGPFMHWKLGEFFEIDFAGCDCLLVKMDVFRNIEPPWFATDWVWEEGQEFIPLATEDFYFYVKARKAGYKLWCDTSVQCLHEDRNTGQQFGLTADMPQYTGAFDLAQTEKPEQLLIADLGCGLNTPYFGENVKVVRFDIRAEVNPDIQCDLRKIPQKSEIYDGVHAQHVLEHFRGDEAPKLIREWARILKVGGKLILNVPDVEEACEKVVAMEKSEIAGDIYPWWQLYGQQSNPFDIHKNGFTRRVLEKLLKMDGEFDEIEVKRVSPNLEATAIKARSWKPFVLEKEFIEAVEAEQKEIETYTQGILQTEKQEVADICLPVEDKDGKEMSKDLKELIDFNNQRITGQSDGTASEKEDNTPEVREDLKACTLDNTE